MAQFLRCYHAICFMTADREGIDRACVFYQRLLRHFIDDPQRFSRQFEALFLLLREYVISLNNMNCNHTGLEQLDTIANGIQAMRLSTKKRQRYASTLDEIRCMIHYWIADTKQAVEDARRSIAEAAAGEVPWQKLSALREFGYTYYYASMGPWLPVVFPTGKRGPAAGGAAWTPALYRHASGFRHCGYVPSGPGGGRGKGRAVK